MNILNDLAVILSLALTIPCVSYALETLWLWRHAAKTAYRWENWAKPRHALARGIVAGFTKDTLDNIYWMITWTLVLLDYEMGKPLLLWGSAANVFFRQGGGIAAGYEHVHAAHMQHNLPMRGRLLDKWYWGGGAALFMLLSYLNDWNGLAV